MLVLTRAPGESLVFDFTRVLTLGSYDSSLATIYASDTYDAIISTMVDLRWSRAEEVWTGIWVTFFDRRGSKVPGIRLAIECDINVLVNRKEFLDAVYPQKSRLAKP